MMKSPDLLQAAINVLAHGLKGELLTPGNEDYENARAIWNGEIKSRPALIVLPVCTEDVQFAVKLAVSHQIPVTVKGGGHDWNGRALNEGGMVISLARMKEIAIDKSQRIATVQGGITAKELIAKTEPLGLAAVTGTVGAVGLAGLTLGGGYGPLSPSFGLAADNLLGAEVVLADGSVILADEENNADLLWALRGGGGNFGVVTSMTIQLHPVKPLLAGIISFPWQQAAAVMAGYAKLMTHAPDELAVFAGMMPDEDGKVSFLIMPVWHGTKKDGKQHIEAIKQLGTPSLTPIDSMPLSQFLGIFDPHIANGRYYAIQTRWLPDLPPAAISAMINGADNRTSKFSFINIHHFHGKPARVWVNDTAFGIRQPHFMVEVIAAWDPKHVNDSAVHHKWASDISDSIAAGAFPGGYPNLLSDRETGQIDKAYGVNKVRLQALKKVYDSKGVFNASPIPGFVKI